MDKKRFIRKLGISTADEKAIAETVAEAEQKTNGEIALAIVKQSDDYSALELLISIAAFLLGAVIFIGFSNTIVSFLSTLVWVFSHKLLLSVFLVSTSLLIPLCFLLLNISSFERIFIPKKLRHKNTEKRAMLHFVQSALYKTKDHSGILIFVSVLERTVVVFADEGINSRVEAGTWNGICAKLTDALKKKEAGKGFIEAVEACGTILHEAFPARKNNPNELNNSLAVLDR